MLPRRSPRKHPVSSHQQQPREPITTSILEPHTHLPPEIHNAVAVPQLLHQDNGNEENGENSASSAAHQESTHNESGQQDLNSPGKNKTPPLDNFLEFSSKEKVFSLAFAYISDHTDAVLRKLLKVWNRKVGGAKKELIARAFLYTRLAFNAGECLKNIFAGVKDKNGTAILKDLAKWVENAKDLPSLLKPVPGDEELMCTFTQGEKNSWLENEVLVRENRRRGGEGVVLLGHATNMTRLTANGAIAETETFNLSLFARLCAVLLYDEEAKEAMLAMGQPLSQRDQDRGVSRDSLWDTVATRFNDAELRPMVNLAG